MRLDDALMDFTNSAVKIQEIRGSTYIVSDKMCGPGETTVVIDDKLGRCYAEVSGIAIPIDRRVYDTARARARGEVDKYAKALREVAPRRGIGEPM